MTTTVIPFGAVMAQKKWSAGLAVDISLKSYFTKKFVGEGENRIVQRKTELDSDAGDTISFDLSVLLRNRPVTGDQRVEGREENLRFFTDQVTIDQTRHAVSAGGKMTRKRTAHDLRTVAKERLSDYWAQYIDELTFMNLSGSRGMNQDYIEGLDFSGFAQNPLLAPDSQHQIFAGGATSVATVTNTETMTRLLIEQAVATATMMRAQNPLTPNMMPISIEGGQHFVTVMSPFQEYDMRNNDTGGWVDIQRAAAAAEGKNSPVFKGSLGMINNVILHSHPSVIRFNNYGAGANLPAARALFMGRQAGVVAYGTAGGLRFTWKEELRDFGNEPTVVAGTIIGIKKVRYNNIDFGVMAIDSYSAPAPT